MGLVSIGEFSRLSRLSPKHMARLTVLLGHNWDANATEIPR